MTEKAKGGRIILPKEARIALTENERFVFDVERKSAVLEPLSSSESSLFTKTKSVERHFSLAPASFYLNEEDEDDDS